MVDLQNPFSGGAWKETDIASAATTDIGNLSTLKANITGAAVITSFGPKAHALRLLTFAAAATLTHDAANLKLPGAANIVTAAGDTALATSNAAGQWTVRHYTRADGSPLTTVAANKGGTGRTTLTGNGVLYGAGTNPVGMAAAMTDGQLLVGQTGAAPAPMSISGAITLAANGGATIQSSIALPGSPTTTTQAQGDNSTKIANTSFVRTELTAGNAVLKQTQSSSIGLRLWNSGTNANMHLQMQDGNDAANSALFYLGVDNGGLTGYTGYVWYCNKAGTGAARPIKFVNYDSQPIDLYTLHTLRWSVNSSGHFEPGADNSYSVATASNRASVVYSATSTINTSDERVKQDIGPIPDAVLDAWAQVEYARFKFRDAVAEKGDDGARWHVGVIAQRIEEEFRAAGIDPFAYGLLCHDSWDARVEIVIDAPPELIRPARRIDAVVDDYGEIIEPEREEPEAWRPAVTHEVVHPAGDRYSVRPEECLFLEAALLRRALKRLQSP